MRPYDQQDFERNPGKYRFFQSAQIALPIDSLPELKVDQVMRIRYFDTRLNKDVKMPIYEVFEAGQAEGTIHAMVYAKALKNFVL